MWRRWYLSQQKATIGISISLDRYKTQLESVIFFLDLLYSGVWRGDGVDKLCWKPSSQYLMGFFKFDFTIKSCYLLLMSFPWKSVETTMPTKASFFIWTVVLGWIFSSKNTFEVDRMD